MSLASDRLATRILIGMGVGVAAGALLRLLFPHVSGLEEGARWAAAQFLDPIGKVFLRLLFFVIVPLIFGSLALGVVQLGRLDRLGPLAGRTFALFFLNMAIGVAIGLVLMNVLKPGQRLDPATRERIEAQFAGQVQEKQERVAELQGKRREGILPVLVEMFMPANLLGTVTGNSRDRIGDVLPLIVFAILVGAAGTTLADERRRGLQQFLETMTELMTRIVGWALRIAPYAVAAMLCSTVISLGVEFLRTLLVFTVGILGVMALHLFGTITVLLKLLTRRSPRVFFRAIRTILVTAFSTSSSSATLPTSIAVARDELGVSPSTAGFVLPLGATMNMSGTALYEGCVVLFIAQVYGVDMSLIQQVTLLLLAVLSAVAVAGIPGGSLPLIMGLLSNFGDPPEGIALILGVDRLLDMARTTLNVAADVVTAVVVDEAMDRSARDG